MGDLGNLGSFLVESSISNLDWLEIDEKDYQKNDTLPKQNLDIRPDLEALWAREDESATAHLIPNKTPVEPFPGAGGVHTMGDLSQAHGPLRAQAEEIRRTARLLLMQSSDAGRFQDGLAKRFDLDTLRSHREVLASVLSERGLLGGYYVDAADFPSCDKGGKQASDFVRRFASEARFVVAKPQCGECRFAVSHPTGGVNCAVFQKRIEIQVPYTPELAEAVERSQKAQGKLVQASVAEPRERIKQAMLASASSRATEEYQGIGLGKMPALPNVAPDVLRERLVQASSLVRKQAAATQGSIQAQPVVDLLRREMLKGLSPSSLVKSLRLAFDLETLKTTQGHWAPLLKEAGLFGVVYASQDSFRDCESGVDFLSKYNPGIRAIVAGSKCESCYYNKGQCLIYGKPLIRDASELYTPETVEAVLTEHRLAGRLPEHVQKQASSWGSDPRETLKKIHTEVCRCAAQVATASDRMDLMKAFQGEGVGFVANTLTQEEITKKASRLLNEGLYGKDLVKVLRSEFEPRDLKAAEKGLRTVLAEQGLQGIFYVDPTAYSDYGRGCEEAARLHRSRMVQYVKLGSQCVDCLVQLKPGFCSKLNKTLVKEPPYLDKKAQQREVLASGRATEIRPETLLRSGISMLAEFQMQQRPELPVEVREASVSEPVAVEFNPHCKLGL